MFRIWVQDEHEASVDAEAFDAGLCVAWLLRIQDETGGFPSTVVGPAGEDEDVLDVVRTYWAICSLETLGVLDKLDRDRTASFISSLQKEDGHFCRNMVEFEQNVSLNPNPPEHIFVTSVAVMALEKLGRLDTVDTESAMDFLIDGLDRERLDPMYLCLLIRALGGLGVDCQLEPGSISAITEQLIQLEVGLEPGNDQFPHVLGHVYWSLCTLLEQGSIGDVWGEEGQRIASGVVGLQLLDRKDSTVQDVFYALGILMILKQTNLVSLTEYQCFAERCQVHLDHVEGIQDSAIRPYLLGGIGPRPQQGKGFPLGLEPMNSYYATQVLDLIRALS